MQLTAVMPCLNEEKTVGTCIDKAIEAFRRLGMSGEVVVADNGSTDRSIEIAAAHGARVIKVSERGYGAALIAGISAARGDYVIMADADDSYDWLQIGEFVHALDRGFDLVVGNRFAGGIDPGAMPALHRYLGNPVLSWLARAIHGAPIGDFHCGMRAFRREAFARLNTKTPGMEFATEMIVNAVEAHLKISEIPIQLHRDGRGGPTHLRSFRDGWRHLRFILTYGPNYLYLAPGGLFFFAGLAMVIALGGGPIPVGGHYFGIHFIALACTLTLVGFNIIHYGILAKVIGLRRMPESTSRIARWAVSSFSLEVALLIGGFLVVGGLAGDGWLLLRWIKHPGIAMDSTVHAVFGATLAIVIGFNLSVGSFLLYMLVRESPR